jgi:hypothetical protein
MSQRERMARKALATSSWALLAIVLLGNISTIHAINASITAAPPGSFPNGLLTVLLVLIGISFLATWAAGLWHAGVNQQFNSKGQKITVLCVLIVFNAVGALLYYFTYVHWLPVRSTSGAAA